jgi:diguanylate cyclase (GGDEF)-like protein
MGALTIVLDSRGVAPVVVEVHDGLGWGCGDVVGRPLAAAFPCLVPLAEPVLHACSHPEHGPGRAPIAIVDLGGTSRTVEVEALAIPGELVALVVIDVSAHHEALEVVRHQADTDDLTGLPNRRSLLEATDAAIGEGAGACLAVLDLNGFKGVNDTLGHRAGDLYLVAIARRLDRVVGAAGFVARLGGDEFAILVPSADAPGADRIVREVVDACRQPVSVRGVTLASSASVGTARQPDHGRDAEELLHSADVAMYRAKRDRSGPVSYDPAMDRPADGMELLAEVPAAMAEGRFRMYYQPKVAPITAAVVGFEALVRWDHPTRGLLAPDEFLDLLLVAGYTEELARWALTDAVLQLSRLPHPISVAVNLTAPDVRDTSLPERCARLLAEAGVDPGRLTIEITESHVLDPTGLVAEVLGDLTQLGVRVAVDDFGTGFASLSHLRALPLSELKIDRSFVLGMRSGLSDATIVRSVIELGHNLGLGVTAEGVEDDMTARRLTEMGVDTLQGFLYGLPAPAPHQWALDLARMEERDAPAGSLGPL